MESKTTLKSITKNGDLYCLNDWVENVVKSKDPRTYYRKLKYPKQKIDGKWYVDKESMNEIYSRSTAMHGRGLNSWYGKYGKEKNPEGKNLSNENSTKGSDIISDNMDEEHGKLYNDSIDDELDEYSVGSYVISDDEIELDEEVEKESNKEIVIKKADDNSDTRLIDMENGVLKFNGKDVKMLTDKDGEVWFKGGDVANILEYKKAKNAIQNNVDNEDKMELGKICPTNLKGALSTSPLENSQSVLNEKNVQLTTLYINESGLYTLIMKSKMKKAKEFQRWITKEVLPAIRKTGQYDITDSIKTNTVPQIAYDLNNYLNKDAVYLLHIKDNIYKYGVTTNMKKRGKALKNLEYKSVHRIFTVNNNNIGLNVEDNIKTYVKQMGIHKHFDVITKTAIDPKNDYKKKGKRTEFFIADKKTLEEIELKVVEYVKSETDKFKDSNTSGKELNKQLELANTNKNRDFATELKCTNAQLKLAAINLEAEKVKLEQKKLEAEIERLKYSGMNYDKEQKEGIVAKPIDRFKKYTCIGDDCTKLIHRKDQRCTYCHNKHSIIVAANNGRPTYKKLQHEKQTMKVFEIASKYKVSSTTINDWIKSYKKYNLMDL